VGEEVAGSVTSLGPAARVGVLLLVMAIAACVRPEDPVRAELRARLKLENRLSTDELDRLRHEVSRAVAGKRFRIAEGETIRDLTEQEQGMLLAMLDQPAGMFDEGLRRVGGARSGCSMHQVVRLMPRSRRLNVCWSMSRPSCLGVTNLITHPRTAMTSQSICRWRLDRDLNPFRQ